MRVCLALIATVYGDDRSLSTQNRSVRFRPIADIRLSWDAALMALFSTLSRGQRVSLATLLTMFAVGGLEIAHFSSGTTPLLEVGYFAIPAAIAIALFETMKARTVAFVLLTAVGFLAVWAAISYYLTH